METRAEYEIITYDEFKKRKDGGCYLLYWSETKKYYFGRAVVYGRRNHERNIKIDIYLNRHWKKHGPPDTVVVIPLDVTMQKSFEDLWLAIFRRGPLYDRSVCLNTSKRADAPTPTLEQIRKGIATQKKKGTGLYGLTHEQHVELGRVQGRRNVENGQLAGIATKGGRANVESGQIYRMSTPESCSRGGRTQGRRNVESGWAAELGRISGQKNVESGWMAELGRKYGPIQGRKNRKLTPAQVADIRHLLALGDMTQKEIAEHYPITGASITNIKMGRTYADW